MSIDKMQFLYIQIRYTSIAEAKKSRQTVFWMVIIEVVSSEEWSSEEWSIAAFARTFLKQGSRMLSSTPYINPAMIGGAAIGARTGADAGVRPAPSGAESNQNRDTRRSNTTASAPVFPADGDTIELSPAARQLAQQKPGSTDIAADETSGSAPGSAQNETPAPQNQGARSGDGNAETTANNSAPESAESDATGEDGETDAFPPGTSSGMTTGDLPPAKQQEVQQLKQRDQEVRTHEAAHAAVGGQYAGAPSLEYETGPDGKRYAVSGEVSIDLGKVKGDPQETIDKMEQVQAAALAPAQPSAQDRRVAARAAQVAAQARMDLRMEQSGAMAAQAQAQATSPFEIPANGENETPQNLAPSPSAPAPSIESLRWTGAIA